MYYSGYRIWSKTQFSFSFYYPTNTYYLHSCPPPLPVKFILGHPDESLSTTTSGVHTLDRSSFIFEFKQIQQNSVFPATEMLHCKTHNRTLELTG